MKRSGFKKKIGKGLRRTAWKKKPAAKKGRKKKAETSGTIKKRIQSLLRANAINRDGTCVLSRYTDAGCCSGRRSDGELILQAEHLVGRSNSASYADMDNIVLLCLGHHFYFKKQHGAIYWDLIRKIIGEERWKKVQEWERDHTPHRFTKYDWEQAEKQLQTMLRVPF